MTGLVEGIRAFCNTLRDDGLGYGDLKKAFEGKLVIN